MQNRAIEIHDSILDSISVSDGRAALHFARAYIHQSTGTPGRDVGSGWVQEVLLLIDNAVVDGSFSEFPRDLLDGHIKIGTIVSRNMIPIPLHHEGSVELRLESWNDEVILITGSRAELGLIGEPKCVEEFRPDKNRQRS